MTENPFVTNGYAGPEYFCDRVEETQIMVPPQTTLDEIFNYLSSADKHCLVAIDEFLQIVYYHDNKSLMMWLSRYITAFME